MEEYSNFISAGTSPGTIVFRIFFYASFVFIIIGIIFVLRIIFSKKGRSKWIKKQSDIQNAALKYSKESIEDIGANIGSIGANVSKRVLDENQEAIEYSATKSADLNSKSIEKIARSIKKGLSEEESLCRYCKKSIDIKSKFCKECGKQQ